MAHSVNLLAFDLGAESGRAMLGRFDGARLALSEIHRFANVPVALPDGLHWDVLRLWAEIKQGMALAVREVGTNLAGLGLDTWGVDFALLDRDGRLVANPHHYRDSRTDGMVEEAFRRAPRAEIFARTGIQIMPINSLYQLLSMVVSRSPALEVARTFLTIPDLFNYWLSGHAVCELSNATTTQCYDPRRRDWAKALLDGLGIPTDIFPDIVPPGTVLGRLLPSVAEETGLGGVPVVAPACHDTGSAVAAVPAVGPVVWGSPSSRGDVAWISSGTWSVMGAEVPAPVINAQSLAFNITNEGSAMWGMFRFSKNVMGLWLVQECRRTWARLGEEYSYDDLTRMAAQAAPFQAVIDPDYGEFLKPGDMPARVRAYCQATGQAAPEGQGAIVRCLLEGIALKYRWVLERLEEILGRRLDPIHIVGGGTRNQLLSQFTADATGRQVITGPAEATAAGNIMVQAVALGHVASLGEARAVVRDSFDVQTFEPAGDRSGWEEAYAKLLTLVG